MSQVHKGVELSRTKVKNNILKMWHGSAQDDRHDWYNEANLWCEDNSKGYTLAQAAGVVAALSPVKKWDQNLVCAEDMIGTDDCGHMGVFKDKARRILRSDGTDEAILDILNGRKISSFYLNIRYPDKANNVTIDRHALSIALGHKITDKEYQGMTAKQYAFFVECYTIAAAKVDISPVLMQSTTWVYYRREGQYN
jgi:hypothetical protein